MQRTREEVKQEAIKRMKFLKIMPEIIRDFKEDDLVSYSQNGILYWIDGSNEITEFLSEKIKELEEERDCLVYHVIETRYVELGTMYTFLIIPLNDFEWECEKADLEVGIAFCYVYNKTFPECSEFGYVTIKNKFGGLVRA